MPGSPDADHNSCIVEMREYLVVFDAPVGDSTPNWNLSAARAKYPGKPRGK